MKLIIRTKNKNFDSPFFEMQQFEGEPRFIFNVDANCNFEFTKRLYNSAIENEVLEFCIDTDRDKDYLLEELEKMDTVFISPYDTNITRFFEINPDLQNKKMMLLGKYSVLDNKTLIEISKKFEKFENNVYVNLEGNVEPVLLMDACRTTSEIERRA